jgi:hypothetical protein
MKMNNYCKAKRGLNLVTALERTKDNETSMQGFISEPVKTSLKQPVKRGRQTPYMDIQGTDFRFYIDGGVLFFRPVKGGVSPIKITEIELRHVLSLGESGLSSYLHHNYSYQNSRWLVQKLIVVVKSGAMTFFDINPDELDTNLEYVFKPKTEVARKQYQEPEINRQIRASLRRSDPKNRSS